MTAGELLETRGASLEVQELGRDHFRADVVLSSAHGLHMRPAQLLAAAAMKYACRISISKGTLRADARSLLQLFSLVAEQGAPLAVEAEGHDAADAVAELGRMIAGGFPEVDAER